MKVFTMAEDQKGEANTRPIDQEKQEHDVVTVVFTAERKEVFIASSPTAIILERLRPLCTPNTMIQLRLEGTLSRGQYHQLDLNSIRRYGEEHCFALAIDDSALALLPEQEAISIETGERFSPREELILLADEWITKAKDEQEKNVLRATKEELLVALDEIQSNYIW